MLGIQLWWRYYYDFFTDEHVHEILASVNGRLVCLRLAARHYKHVVYSAAQRAEHEFVTWLLGPRDLNNPERILERYEPYNEQQS